MAAIPVPEVVAIPEGSFFMGDDAGRDDEQPRHRVTLDAFGLGVTAVTREQYAAFLEDTRRAPPKFYDEPEFGQPLHPIVGVTWFDAVAYAEWLSLRTGLDFRLPTEAEWERAVRGGVDDRRFPWGDEPPEARPRYRDLYRDGTLVEVGTDGPFGFGLFDPSGNVHEWVADWYAADYYRDSPERSPKGPDSGTRRASRGGSWRHHVRVSRCAARSSLVPSFEYSDYGFRIARSL